MAHRYIKERIKRLQKERKKIIDMKMEEQITIHNTHFKECLECRGEMGLKVRLIAEKHLDTINDIGIKPDLDRLEIIAQCRSNKSHNRTIFTRDNLTGEIITVYQLAKDGWIVRPCRIKYTIDTKEKIIKEAITDLSIDMGIVK